MEEPPKLFDDFKTGDELIWFNDREKIMSQNEKSKISNVKHSIKNSPWSVYKSEDKNNRIDKKRL